MHPEHIQLAKHVQRNCHISDARHAGDYTLCIYLLKMREYYRWEKSYSFSESLSTDDVGDWLTSREHLWEGLEDAEYEQIETGQSRYDPFDSKSINEKLLQHGLVYSGGIGHKARPHFFLAKLESKKKLNGYTILTAAEEYARDLTSPPAMSQGNTIYIRRESFKRMIWEKTEEWRWNKPKNAMAKAMHYYNFDKHPEQALESMTNSELESAVLHEIGEIKAGETLKGWANMMPDIASTQAEIMARAARDHLADAISTLPSLVEHNKEASIHFYFANLTNMRKLMFPSLLSAYQNWIESHKTSALQKTIDKSMPHWQNITNQMLELHKRHRDKCSTHIESLVTNNYL